MNIVSMIVILIFVVACDNLADRFGLDKPEDATASGEKNAPHPFEVTEQSGQEGQIPQQGKQDPGFKQESVDSKFTCEADSPALVMYDREAQGLFFCNQGAWSPVASQDKMGLKQEHQGQASNNKGKFGVHGQFVIRPSTDSFLCTQSENFPKSYICSKKDRLIKKANKHPSETTLTRGP